MANILIIDDSRTFRRMAREALENAGHTIVGEAVNGEDGYRMFQELKPDIVTLDIVMPELDGMDTLQLIRKSDEKAKVVMITSSGQKQKIIEAIEGGAVEFLVKPFGAEEIVRAIEKAANS